MNIYQTCFANNPYKQKQNVSVPSFKANNEQVVGRTIKEIQNWVTKQNVPYGIKNTTKEALEAFYSPVGLEREEQGADVLKKMVINNPNLRTNFFKPVLTSLFHSKNIVGGVHTPGDQRQLQRVMDLIS